MAWLEEVMYSSTSHSTPHKKLDTGHALISQGDGRKAMLLSQPHIQDHHHPAQLTGLKPGWHTSVSTDILLVEETVWLGNSSSCLPMVSWTV